METESGPNQEVPDGRQHDHAPSDSPPQATKEGERRQESTERDKQQKEYKIINSTENGQSNTESDETDASSSASDDDSDRSNFLGVFRCPVNRRPHFHLTGFGLLFCPLCHQTLEVGRAADRPPTPIRQPVVCAAPPVAGPIPGVRPADLAATNELETESPNITYSVKFLDTRYRTVESVPCKDLFDLSEARSGLSSENALFSVRTVIKTSVEPSPGPGNLIPGFHKRALTNPSIFMEVKRTIVTIRSPSVIRALKDVVSYYPQTSLSSHTVDLPEPYTLVAHYFEELEAYRKTIGIEEISKNLGLLLDFFKEKIFQTKLEDEKARYSMSPAMCTFRMLWLLFRPGSTVYVQSGGKIEACVVRGLHVDKAILSVAKKTFNPLILDLWYLDFDGEYVGRCETTVTIPSFDGERTVTSLAAFPCEFLDRNDEGKTREKLEARGRRWYKLLRGGLVQYAGEFVGESRQFFEGRVVVDSPSFLNVIAPHKAPIVGELDDMWQSLGNSSTPDSDTEDDSPYVPRRRNRRGGPGPGPPPGYRGPPPPPPPPGVRPSFAPQFARAPKTIAPSREQDGLNCSCENCQGLRPHPPPDFRWTKYDMIDPMIRETLETDGINEPPGHLYLLCPRELYGLALKSRQWETLDVEFCFPVKRNTLAIENLVMPEDRKMMIKALVDKFTSPGISRGPFKQWRADWIENKGEGQIFLLHGSPGVGKTFTAECIAEFTERPLLSLTCGDIGTNEVTAERKLSGWFQLAEKWGAVMLLDEADVFLEKRQLTDLNRNSLVSVFLRAVEYYRGILFLTTNRVGHFDDAFVSRIHVIIAYDNLGEVERIKIWKQFFQKLADEREDIYIDARAKRYVLDDPVMRNMNWNGREIRNAFQTAVALAEYRFRAKKDKQDDDMITLGQSDFEQVCEMTIRFKKYLTNVHGGDESTRAYVARARLDHDID